MDSLNSTIKMILQLHTKMLAIEKLMAPRLLQIMKEEELYSVGDPEDLEEVKDT